MKRGKNFWSLDTTIVLLAALSLALIVTVGVQNPKLLIPAGAVFLLAAVALLLGMGALRSGVRRALSTAEHTDSGLSQLAIPVAILSNGTVVWANESFNGHFGGKGGVLAQLDRLLPDVDLELAQKPEGQDVPLFEHRYTVYASPVKNAEDMFVLVFSEDTVMKDTCDEFYASRPAVLYFLLDTYDEIIRDMPETQRARILSNVDLALDDYVGKTSGFVRRLSASRSLAVVEERHVAEMMRGRFAILDAVRALEEDGVPVTLSVGVGRADTFAECEALAAEALEMALGRGGDQAAVKGPDGYEFYGGVTKGVEKRTKVKSRVVSAALRDSVQNAARVLVMGHRNADMDALGAAVGMLRFARICGRPAHIVIDREHNQVQSLLDELCACGHTKSFLSPSAAVSQAGPGTLLVIVDTHAKHLLESEEIYEMCNNVAVIDHHRLLVGHIDDADIMFHEPSASSASELVAELLMYLDVDTPGSTKLEPVEADALLAGIMLDTRTFSLHVGARTFEAAAFLRRAGAETEEVKRLFCTTMDDYLSRSHLVGEAKIYHHVAVTVSGQVPRDGDVVAAQAANDLLTIEGVKASVVAVKQGGQILVSARSMGEVNVQLIMEALGGGGHLTMAGAQLKGLSTEEAEEKIFDAIDEYRAKSTVSADL